MSEDTEAEESFSRRSRNCSEELCLKKKIQDTVEEKYGFRAAVEISQEEVEEFPNSEEVSEEENPEFIEAVRRK